MADTKLNHDLICKILESYKEPIIFEGYIDNWKLLQWNLRDWERKLRFTKLQFRKYNYKNATSPIWDQTCTTTNLTMREFIKVASTENNNFWLYFDYKYMRDWFQKYTDILNDISWARFGHPEMTGNDSSIWIGSQGAHTPCHMDTYGYNLIAQIYGRKRWIVFPPDADLKPTRVPYEESTVYSKINFFNPNYNELKHLKCARVVDLSPGQVLYLPVGWWHYVENLETAISINVWIPQAQDDARRIEEAFTQLFVSQISKILDKNEQSMIFNPNSLEIQDMSLSNSLALLNQTIEVCKIPTMFKSSICSRPSVVSSSTIDESAINHTLQENKTIKLIPILSEDEFASLIQQQQSRYFGSSDEEYEDQKSINVERVENIINAVCSPDVLTLIGKNLLEE